MHIFFKTGLQETFHGIDMHQTLDDFKQEIRIFSASLWLLERACKRLCFSKHLAEIFNIILTDETLKNKNFRHYLNVY